MFKFLGIILFLLISVSSAHAEFVYRPLNPSFGGNPQYTSHLMSLAGAQKNATASDYVAPITDDPTDPGSTGNDAADLFVRQLQSRLLSALASQVTDAIFGDTPQDSGTITFGDTEITFDRSNGEIALTISDFGDGTVTNIIVPQLVTN